MTRKNSIGTMLIIKPRIVEKRFPPKEAFKENSYNVEFPKLEEKTTTSFYSNWLNNDFLKRIQR